MYTQSTNNNKAKAQSIQTKRRRLRRYTYETVVFAMLGTIMFCSKIIMEALPNIHLLGMLTVLYTVVFRAKALIPIYIYVFLNGLYAGFALWWVPYLYLWAVLWGATMLVPKSMSDTKQRIVYPIICGMHGFLYGILYAPAQALMYSYSFSQLLAWLATGIWADIVHGVSNVALGLLVVPLAAVLKRLNEKALK